MEQNLSFDTLQGSFNYRVAALILNEDHILMAKFSGLPCYYTVGGRVRINETSEEAAIREAFEETGLVFQIDRLAYVQERFFMLKNKRYHEIALYYFMKPNEEISIAEDSVTDQGEKETLHWLPVASLDEYEIIPNFLKELIADSSSGIRHIVLKE